VQNSKSLLMQPSRHDIAQGVRRMPRPCLCRTRSSIRGSASRGSTPDLGILVRCRYLPGATKQQPGIKIRYVDTDLLGQFPDQFAPFTFFGCNLRDPFRGTLFRFPLRTEELARESEISKSR
jgi:hypothetical protein